MPLTIEPLYVLRCDVPDSGEWYCPACCWGAELACEQEVSR